MFTTVPMLEAAEGKRVALVVGIGTYDNLLPDKQLRNAVNDADGVSAKLSEIGFKVMKEQNLARHEFNAKWQNVLDSLTAEDTFVLFFSGHGIQIEGENYLLPRDIPFIEYGKQEQLKREAISVNQVLNNLITGNRPHPKRVVVILDACRDNPLIPAEYKGFGSPSGLAKPSSTEGLFVIYSAVENSVSLDRLPTDGKAAQYSVFTRVLLPLLGRQDLTLQDLSVTLKKQVSTLAKNAGRRQLPSYYDGTDGEPFCLPGCLAGSDNSTVRFKENLSVSVLTKTRTGKDGAPMVLVPAGEFMMGSRDDDENAESNERPAHLVYLDAFYIDQFEVTTTRYAKFLQETKQDAPSGWSDQFLKQYGRKPVVAVDWSDANAYCSWSGKRLPTEAEWEKAARGTDQRPFPWGDTRPSNKNGSFPVCCSHSYEVLADVGSVEQGKSPYGVYDMAGNAWEWVADWYDENYYSKRHERNPKGPPNGQQRVFRGENHGLPELSVDGFEAYDGYEIKAMRSAIRSAYPPGKKFILLGFRCAQDIPK